MDPDAAMKDLLEAVHVRNWDRVDELAEGLLSWMEKRGIPANYSGTEGTWKSVASGVGDIRLLRRPNKSAGRTETTEKEGGD